MTQLELPFLTRDQVATIDAARAAIERSQTKAWMARRSAEADELGRIGEQLVALLEANSAAVRANHPAHHPAAHILRADDGTVDQAHTGTHRRSEPNSTP